MSSKKKSVKKTVLDKYDAKSGQPWTEKEMAMLYELRVGQGRPFRTISTTLNRTRKACETKFHNTRWELKSFYNKDKCRLRENMKRALVEKVANNYDNRLETASLATEILADRLEETVKAIPNVKKRVYTQSRAAARAKAKQKHCPEDVVLIISDMHIGHHHTLEETGGVSEYNFDIFKKRVQFIQKATTDIVELHSKLYDLPNLHLFCPGDVVAGMNAAGAWSSTYINMPILDQAVAGAEALADMITYWLGMFDDIYFYGVMGNHGRGAPKGTEKEYVNWDYLCYKFLESRFKDNPRVHFVVPKTWWIFTEIRNHKFLMLHGDDIRGSSKAKAFEACTERMSSIIKKIPDYTIAGHFHSAAEFSTNFGRILLNGSFVGSDIYSLKALVRATRPEQKLFGIHDKMGITWTYNLDLSIAR